MIGRIPKRAAKLAVAILAATALLAVAAGAASASEVVYNNLNTVATTVNGLPNEDTLSATSTYFPVGGMVKFANTDRGLRTLTTEVDSFTCEYGVYSLENCYTLHPNKKYSYELTASIYTVGPENAVGSLVATSTQTFKIHYRPTTNVSCPSTPEGKGFGKNCDVGGLLATIKFKFAPGKVLPAQAIILITNTLHEGAGDYVNVGLQESEGGYVEGHWVNVPAADNGEPAVGSDPLLNSAIFYNGAINESWEGGQPVFEVTAARH
jgi:hypothetical protein